jgi:hypothetical protein
LQEEDEEMM